MTAAQPYEIKIPANADLAFAAADPNVSAANEDIAVPVGDPSKRVFDVIAGTLALIPALPLMVLIAIAVRLAGPGPILHWSEREGFHGKRFWMPKFRTMHTNAPLTPREQMVDADEFLTSIGGFLRATGLDELPQLFVIIAGKMSLIGPRPLLPTDEAMIERRRSHVALLCRPGITGLAQIKGRNALSPRRKARYDAFYVMHWNWFLDIGILLKTILIILSRRGFL